MEPPKSNYEASSGPSSKSSTGPSTGTSSSQASTLPPPNSQESSPDSDSNVWGRLSVFGRNQHHDLVQSSYTVGRTTQLCQIILPVEVIGNNVWHCCSKKHFRIYVEHTSTARCVFVEDFSTNGTYINNRLVGQNQFDVLKNGDVISVFRPSRTVFHFIDFKAEEDESFPAEVKEKYMYIKDLGSGAWGVVKLAVRRSDSSRLACKCLDKKKLNFSHSSHRFDREVSIMKKLDHPCIIKIQDTIETTDMFFIFMELVEGGDLFNAIRSRRRLDEDHAKHVFYQICLAVKYLHDQKVIHRDLKPENILLTSKDHRKQQVKVTDFGLSKFVESASLQHSLCGTMFYVAPEIVSARGMTKVAYTSAVDCWSLGVILYVCITGQPAFSAEREDLGIVDQITQGSYTLKDKYWEHLPDAKDLVQKLLTVDPSQRISLDETLNHKWLQDDKMRSLVQSLMGGAGVGMSSRPEVVEDDAPPAAKKMKLADIKENHPDLITPLLPDSGSSTECQPTD